MEFEASRPVVDAVLFEMQSPTDLLTNVPGTAQYLADKFPSAIVVTLAHDADLDPHERIVPMPRGTTRADLEGVGFEEFDLIFDRTGDLEHAAPLVKVGGAFMRFGGAGATTSLAEHFPVESITTIDSLMVCVRHGVHGVHGVRSSLN